jgi:squalene cyclase
MPRTVLASIDRFCPANGGMPAALGGPADAMAASQLSVLAHDLASVRVMLGRRLGCLLNYVTSCQQEDGHWERDSDDWHTSITAWAVLALSVWRGPGSPEVQRGANWILARQRRDGGFIQSDATPEPNTYATSHASAALHHAGVGPEPVDRALQWLQTVQHQDGSFTDRYSVAVGGDPSLTAYVAHAVSRLPLSRAHTIKLGCETFLAKSQRSSGAWSAWFENTDSLEGTAAALRVLMREPSSYQREIQNGLAYLKSSACVEDLDPWVVISLAHVILQAT